MALGEITKQIAQQALLTATTKEAAAPAQAQPENIGGTVLAQIAAMQKALKEDEELAVTFQSGADRIRVLEIFMPSRGVAVLSGVDQDRSRARAIAPVESLQLVVRVVKAQAGNKPARVSIVVPKS